MNGGTMAALVEEPQTRSIGHRFQWEFLLRDRSDTGNSHGWVLEQVEVAEEAHDGGVIAVNFRSGARWFRWMTDIEEHQNGVIVTSSSSMSGRRSLGRDVEVRW
jgi:hypothetical protein